MPDTRDVRALLRRRGALTLGEVAGVVAGEPIRGTWWAHPKGKEIYDVALALEHADDVVVAKVKDAKVTFVDARLWPALLRLVTDAGFRDARVRALGPEAKRLFARVERAGRLRLETADRAKKELEASLLVRSHSEHTSSGHHATVLESWWEWAKTRRVRLDAMTLEDARAALADAGIVVGDPAPSTVRAARPPASGKPRAPRRSR